MSTDAAQVPLWGRIAGQLALVIGGLAFVYAGQVGHRAGWELMAWPMLGALLFGAGGVIAAVIGATRGAYLAALRTFAPSVLGVLAAGMGLVLGS